ncbi:hypothetical protein [Paraburkholderia sediminicola]|uniref:hypothetical protein n=1 Tax=Paraburkholderia sediminicola TaxID=458836 RepID=UPI0038B99D9A
MKNTNLAQTLAIDSQLRLPGSAGRLVKQIRDIEKVAPLFRDAGLIRAVPKSNVVDLTVAGVASHSSVSKALGGFIYASAAVRTDLSIQENKVSTVGSDSVSELDDIDFEAQRKRLDLVEMRHSYALVARLLEQNNLVQLVLMDTPLFISRELQPLERNARHVAEYERTKTEIGKFWSTWRHTLFPWNPTGPVLVSILADRFNAIVSIARQDLRTKDGRKHVLVTDGLVDGGLECLQDLEARLAGIGDMRFITGILGSHTRTIAFRMSEQQSRMEPSAEVKRGVIGFHYRSSRPGELRLAQMAGDEEDWSTQQLDTVAWRLMVLDMQSQRKAMPLPQLLSRQQLGILDKFSSYYRRGLNEALRSNEVESTWLAGLDEGTDA